jgi:hypothetical protein
MSARPDVSLAAADRLFTAVENGNVEELREIFVPDAWIWHNTDNRAISVEQSIRSIQGILGASTAYRYTEIKRQPTPDGFVQQHVLLITLKSGQKVVDRACCVCSVKDGRIGHMDAYHDSAAFHVEGFGVRT